MTPEQVVAKVFGRHIKDIDDATTPDMLAEWDSLGHVTLVIELESSYGISFGPEDALAMTDVAAIKRVLREQGVSW